MTTQAQPHSYAAVSKTRRVWQLADELTEKRGQLARRADVVKAYVSEGGNANTASTQYSHWKKARLSEVRETAEPFTAAPDYHPSVGKTRRVWQIADELTRKLGHTAPRQAVIDAYISEGGNPGTASVQYSLWKKSRLSSGPALKSDGKPGNAGPVRLEIRPDGALVLPASLRAAMALPPSGVVTARVVDGELRMQSQNQALKTVQERLSALGRGKGSVVDELIAERRAEARRESGA